MIIKYGLEYVFGFRSKYPDFTQMNSSNSPTVEIVTFDHWKNSGRSQNIFC